MKANELMVGDWLKHANGKYYRVTRIDILGDYNSIHYACGFPHLWEYNNKFEPIPLTPDILEKNGWIKDGYFYRAKDGSYIQLGQLFEHATFSCEKYGINREVSTSPSMLKYVHQLQHAMRICGIDKTIEL